MTLRRRASLAVAILASPALAILLLSIDASSRRRTKGLDSEALGILARRLPTSDLALSGGARWLRAPSLEEPGAPFADGPAVPDPDPAGGAMAPPGAER